MSVFKDYAAYYDLLYKDKNYAKEAELIHQLIQKQLPGAKKILNLGCGTGNHDFYLTDNGYDITGIDLSEEMIELANDKKKEKKITNIDFRVGDVRSIRIEKKFDVVISLFHVLSYQLTNEDVIKQFNTAAYHLNNKGIFIFDCWYGPGVLSDKPQVRHRALENEKIRIHRIANPVMHTAENIVDVNYTILVHNKADKCDYEINERHQMRYFFNTELELFSQNSGFQIQHSSNWFDHEKLLGFSDWQAIFTTKKL
jgi:SAM-dependent methyltransferase